MPRPSAARRAALPGALAALLVTAAPAAANQAGEVTHGAGAVSATLEWDRADYGIANPRLFVMRQGVRYDLTIVDICDEGCIVVPDDPGTAPGQSAVKVADLDGGGEPEVLIDTFSGGAHCCVTARLLTWNGTGYTPYDIAYRDVSYELKDADGDGRQELVGYDPRFSESFTYFAATAFPARVLQVAGGATVDVTKRFPGVVAADATGRLKDLRALGRRDDVRGVLAAYVADLYSLRKGTTAMRELDRQIARRRITKGFKKLLLKRLKSWGYR